MTIEEMNAIRGAGWEVIADGDALFVRGWIDHNNLPLSAEKADTHCLEITVDFDCEDNKPDGPAYFYIERDIRDADGERMDYAVWKHEPPLSVDEGIALVRLPFSQVVERFAEQIAQVREMPNSEPVEANPDNDEFQCEKCRRICDIEDSVRRDDGELWCAPCAGE